MPSVAGKNKGHYVYINDYDPKKKICNVNLITSLENYDHDINLSKIKKIRKGFHYNIPFYDANFSRWSSVNLTLVKNVELSDISFKNKYIKRKHKFFIHKFSK